MTPDRHSSAWRSLRPLRTVRLLLLFVFSVATLAADRIIDDELAEASVPLDLSRPAAPSGAGLNVILISIDTLRSDRLGSYGSTRGLTPHLDAFAAESVRFHRTVSQAPWTIPSHMTLFTSLFPSTHGVNRGFREFQADPVARHSFRALRPDTRTLAELLRSAGYRTLALTGGATMSSGFGFERGFDEYLQGPEKLGDETANQLQIWFDRPSDRPFFAFFHTFEVHAPYHDPGAAGELMTRPQALEMSRILASGPESPLDAQRDFLRQEDLFRPDVTSALYDGGVAAVDEFLGALFDRMRASGLLDRTLVIVTSDHGEEFADHDPERFFDAHCAPMYRELLRVPLLVRFPPLAPRGVVVKRFVGLIDVAPTILDLLDLPIPDEFQGRSLEPLMVGGEVGPAWTLSESTCIGPEVKALRIGNYKYIATFALGEDGDRSRPSWPPLREELYDRTTDRYQKVDLSRALPEVTARMRAALARRIGRSTDRDATPEPPHALDQRTLLELRSLGYV